MNKISQNIEKLIDWILRSLYRLQVLPLARQQFYQDAGILSDSKIPN